jgi:hypothetical protein
MLILNETNCKLIYNKDSDNPEIKQRLAMGEQGQLERWSRPMVRRNVATPV